MRTALLLPKMASHPHRMVWDPHKVCSVPGTMHILGIGPTLGMGRAPACRLGFCLLVSRVLGGASRMCING